MIRPLCAALVIVSICMSAQADLQIWTTSSTIKILETDDSHGATPQPVKLSAARREVAAFQIAMRSDKDLPVVHATCSLDGATVAIWREHYVKTKEGNRPDPLSPMKALDLRANVTQPLFIEIEIPANAKPGPHKGQIEITGGAKLVSIPIELTVHDFELPMTPSLRTAFGNQPQFVQFENVPKEGAEFKAMQKKYYDALLEHGLSPYDIPENLMSPEAEPYLSDPRMTSYTIPFPDKDEDLKALVDRLRKGGWFKKGYFYLVDEPAKEESFKRLTEVTERLKRVVGPDYKLVTPYAGNPQFKTDKDIYDLLDGKTTIWCYLTSVHFYRTDKLDAIRAKGIEMWNYVAWVPHSPYCNFLIGMNAIQHRVLFWQEWRYRTTGLLYWSTDWWSNDAGGTVDPWTDMATVKWASKDVFGDGSLLYPGKPLGHDGPLPSLRIKLIRQGLQDYDYIKLASERAGIEKVDAIVNEQVKSWTEYQQDPNALETAKDKLAALIAQAR